jgi:hypothetical protein
MSASWEEIVADVTAIVGAISPVLDIASPAAGAAVSVAAKILTGVSAAEPTAVSLYNQITSGATVTAAQLQTFAANYETAYQKLSADIAAKLPGAIS